MKLKTQLDVWGEGNRLVLHTAEGKPGSPGTAGGHPSSLKAAAWAGDQHTEEGRARREPLRNEALCCLSTYLSVSSLLKPPSCGPFRSRSQ